MEGGLNLLDAEKMSVEKIYNISQVVRRINRKEKAKIETQTPTGRKRR